MGFWSRTPSQVKETVDFDAAARELFAQLNLRPGDINRTTSYNPVDAVSQCILSCASLRSPFHAPAHATSQSCTPSFHVSALVNAAA
mmetsp:Transcript_19323/g.53871  ORF Transcript_19323/g.53871 Transcript_19323/m.53871 type:complete len:87 (-) Transcript_19323:801-1061(-)